jgi:hypothetical protein
MGILEEINARLLRIEKMVYPLWVDHEMKRRGLLICVNCSGPSEAKEPREDGPNLILTSHCPKCYQTRIESIYRGETVL